MISEPSLYKRRTPKDEGLAIDIRSDVLSRAPEPMLEAMMQANVGDDFFADDPTANLLQKTAAEFFGFEDSLILPSTSMGNLIAVMLWTKPGDEVISWWHSHSADRQCANVAMIAGVQTRQIMSDSGVIDLSEISKRTRHEDDHLTYPGTSLVSIENPTIGGEVWPREQLEKLKEFCESQKIKVHCDGARMLNAIEYYQCEPNIVGKLFDSMTLCLSKGLCCPFGSLIFGSREAMDKARRIRKCLGGGLRQIGVIGAAGLWALANMRSVIRQDNRVAKYLGSLLVQIPQVEIDCSKIQINLVKMKIKIDNFDGLGLQRFMKDNGVIMNAANKQFGYFRLMTHRVVREQQCNKVVDLIKKYIEQQTPKTK